MHAMRDNSQRSMGVAAGKLSLADSSISFDFFFLPSLSSSVKQNKGRVSLLNTCIALHDYNIISID